MQTTVRQQTPRESLLASAKRLLPAMRSIGERYCLITPNDGMPQARAVAAYTTQSGRVTAYKVAMLPPSESSAYATTEMDSAWAVLDHNAKAILFGPEGGIQASVEDQGIATYVLGQLIRLIRSKEDANNYRVIELTFPTKPEGDEAIARWERSSRKATSILESQGFHVSTVAGGTVANAQRFGALAERWNSDKINFLSNARLMSLYNEALQSGATSQARYKTLEADVQALLHESARLNAAEEEAEHLRARTEEQQQQIAQLSEQVSSLLPLQAQLHSVREELEQAHESLTAATAKPTAETLASSSTAPPVVTEILQAPSPAVEDIQDQHAPASTSLIHTHKHSLGTVERVILAVAVATLVILGFLKALAS
ncbi:TPA: hypothetical protein ACKP9S_002792 [Pseudomonas aeruginosa]